MSNFEEHGTFNPCPAEPRYGRFPISSNTLIIRTPLIVLKLPLENCSISSNIPLVFLKLIFK